MLAVPTSGLNSRDSDVQISTLCDWIELSAALQNEPLSITDVADVLEEEGLRTSQERAIELASDAWAELQCRSQWLGTSYPLTVEKRRVLFECSLGSASCYLFCLVTSLSPRYDWWHSQFGPDYIEQGILFEEITRSALRAQFSEWNYVQTGASGRQRVKLRDVVEKISSVLSEPMGRIDEWDTPNAQELGLDLVLFRSFPDGRRGIPFFLLQCASGGNWEEKLHTPDLNLWRTLIQFTTSPARGFAMPFALPAAQFSRACTRVDGLLLDRSRLLLGSERAGWMEHSVVERVERWIDPRVEEIQRRSG